MEPKINIFSRDKKKKVSLQPAVPSLPSSKPKQPSRERKIVSKIEKPSPSGVSYWRSTASQPVKRKKIRRNKKEILSILISIIGAIFVGIIMGASILSIFFTNEPTYSKNSIDSHLYSPNKEPKQILKPFRVYLLQAGIFHHREGAEAKLRSYKEQGLPAVMSMKPPFRIYVGVSVDREEAISLARDIQKKGIKVYIREQSFPPQPKQSSLATVLHQSQSVFRALSHYSIQGLSQASDSSEFVPQIEKKYQQLLQQAQKIQHQLSKQERDQMTKMFQSLGQAVQIAKTQKQLNPVFLWKIQAELLQHVNRYELL